LKKIKPSLIPAVLWLIISIILLTLPGSDIPSNEWLGKIQFDKWVHIGMFSIMVSLFCWALLRKNISNEERKKLFIPVAIICLCYGIGMEYVQKYWVVGRSFDTGDIMADAVGSLVGLIFSRRKIYKKN
jgi:VanZ family protein